MAKEVSGYARGPERPAPLWRRGDELCPAETAARWGAARMAQIHVQGCSNVHAKGQTLTNFSQSQHAGNDVHLHICVW